MVKIHTTQKPYPGLVHNFISSEEEIIDTPLKMEELALEEASGRSAVDKKETKKTKKQLLAERLKQKKKRDENPDDE